MIVEATVLCLVSHVLNFYFAKYFFLDIPYVRPHKNPIVEAALCWQRATYGQRKARDPCVYKWQTVRLNLRICEIPASGPAPCRAGIVHHDQRRQPMTGAFHASSTWGSPGSGFLGKQTMARPEG